MYNLQETWNKVLDLIKQETTKISYDAWFSPLIPKKIDEELHIFYIQSEEDFIIKVLNDRYVPLLESVVKNVLKNPYKVVLQLQSGDPPEVEGPDNRENPKIILKEEYYFNPRYNFENFVVGNNNKYAHAAALAVADAPSMAYNPLFIYGGSGLGKTHLMHAIGHYILENKPELKVLYVSSEMFTNELITALEGQKKDRKKISAFKEKYRNIDVLLVDDIQFIEGKEGTQEEFFHTFNTLYDLNKQIIITSDRAPNKLTKLEDRLTSRFQWNMIADIQPPDYETRAAILRKKAALEDIEINEDLLDVISLIAEKIKFNIRELEGAFSRVISFSTLLNEKITVKFARGILKDIISGNDFNITCDSIKKIVCNNFNIKFADIESAKRARNFAFPRQIAMYLCREITDNSLPKIGESFGGRDHTTVLHAYEKIAGEIKTNTSTAELIDRLKEEISEA